LHHGHRSEPKPEHKKSDEDEPENQIQRIPARLGTRVAPTGLVNLEVVLGEIAQCVEVEHHAAVFAGREAAAVGRGSGEAVPHRVLEDVDDVPVPGSTKVRMDIGELRHFRCAFRTADDRAAFSDLELDVLSVVEQDMSSAVAGGHRIAGDREAEGRRRGV